MAKSKNKIKIGEMNFDDFKYFLDVLIDEKIDSKVRGVVRDEIRHLPSKSEFYNRMDKLSAEIERNRQESIISTAEEQGYLYAD